MDTYLKKDQKGKEEYFVKCKDVELGEYTGGCSLDQTIINFLEYKYEEEFHFLHFHFGMKKKKMY